MAEIGPDPFFSVRFTFVHAALGVEKLLRGRRLQRIGLKPQYGSKNPFPWMSETIDLGKEKNFFETRVNEYQSASNLTW